jgi:hypothetical protein
LRSKQTLEKPSIKIKTDKEDYFEGEVINGSVKLDVKREFGEFVLKIQFVKEENYVLFTQEGD